MPAAVTSAVDTSDAPLTSLAITTTEQEYAFAMSASSNDRVILMTCDQDWFYATIANGPYFLIPASAALSVKMKDRTQSAFVKAKVTSGTLYLLAQEGI